MPGDKLGLTKQSALNVSTRHSAMTLPGVDAQGSAIWMTTGGGHEIKIAF